MKFILGKKENMTEYFSEDGKVIPVTIVEVGPVTVVRVLEKAKDGYDAVLVGYGSQKKERINKARFGTMKGGSYKFLKEFRLKKGETSEVKEGDIIDASTFTVGDKIVVSGTSKGKGFQGVVKRHGFHGVGQQSHGQHDRQRAPGSLGNSSDAARVMKGMKMAGRMGNDRVKMKGLNVVKIFAEKNYILVSGSVPGHNGSIVLIQK